MYAELIDYFHCGIVADDIEKVDFAKLNSRAVTFGYVIHPDCCNEAVEEWLDTLTHDYNATFYKEWSDIISRSRFELFIDQIRHYATTYGTDFSLGNGYVPNDGSIVPSFTNLKVLNPITEDEMYGRCVDVLRSGMALKTQTSDIIVEYIRTFASKRHFDDNEIVDMLTSIKNKEAQAKLCLKFNLLPSDEFGMLRCILFNYTGSSMLIKDKKTINKIRAAARSINRPVLVNNLNDKQIATLSKIFYRFKPLFLAMKNSNTAHVINKIRRAARSNHTPFFGGFWETIVSTPRPIAEVCKRIGELDNFRKIRLLCVIKERLMFKRQSGVFPIRNGSVFVRKDYSPSYDIRWLSDLFLAVKSSLVNSIKDKACLVKLPDNLELTLPSSEKTFVGNIPFGSSFKLDKHNILGVYWRNEWGTNDYDLSMTDVNGGLIAWRSLYSSCDKTVLFSGDMTNADPEASEMLYMNELAPDGFIKLNKFRGMDNSKFRFFYAQESQRPHSFSSGFMVDPNNVKVDTMVEFNGQGEKTIGMVSDGKFYFMDFNSGHNRVSIPGEYIAEMVNSMRRKTKSFIQLREILVEAGFEILEKDDERTPDIDFANLEKDTFIKLLSSEG